MGGSFPSRLIDLSGNAQVQEASRYFAGMFPKDLREGPWHPLARLFLASVASGVVLTAGRAREAGFSPSADGQASLPLPTSRAAHMAQVASSAWGLGILGMMWRETGPWPLVSYTMQSWSLMTLRNLLGALGNSRAAAGTSWQQPVLQLAEALRFPMLVQNSVTVLVWWAVLVPILYIRLDDPKRRAAFMAWNSSFFLLNVHLLNLPLAAASHLLQPRPLTAADLWMGVAAALSYLTLYLGVLDPNGLHFYIILSPRKRYSALVYGAILASYFGLWRGWGKITGGPAAAKTVRQAATQLAFGGSS